jgi:hypothetical protein
MTEREKLIEVMASALYSAGFGAEFDYARRGDPVKGRYRTQAAAALAAIEAMGAVVVPVEATDAMRYAAFPEEGMEWQSPRCTYNDMIAASPYAKEPT